jgi:hypothetical protein
MGRRLESDWVVVFPKFQEGGWGVRGRGISLVQAGYQSILDESKGPKSHGKP